MRPAILLLTAAALHAQVETAIVKAGDGAAYFRNAQPQIARLGDGRLLATFGATAKDSGNGRIVGAISEDDGRTWLPPMMLIDDPKMFDGDANILVDGNTVFVYGTRTGIPNTITKTQTMVTRSTDNGTTWSTPKEIALTRQYMPGKTHNALRLADGTYLMGISWDLWPERGMRARTEGEMWLASGALLSRDGFHWTLHGNISTFQPKVTPGSTNGLCEPATVQLANGDLLMILRSGTSRHWESRSTDLGATWSEPKPSPLVGHNTPSAIVRVEGTGTIVAVWNHSPVNRFPLSAAASKDGGKTWSTPRIIANSTGGLQVSYPGLTQAKDGRLAAIYQAQREDGGRDIRCARFTLDWLLAGR